METSLKTPLPASVAYTAEEPALDSGVNMVFLVGIVFLTGFIVVMMYIGIPALSGIEDTEAVLDSSDVSMSASKVNGSGTSPMSNE